MNYWERWIGDWKRKTAGLSCAERGVYGELLDHQYATEEGLPDSLDRCCRIAGAVSPEERAAVSSVLEQFFPVMADGSRMNPRVVEEVEKRRAYVAKKTAAAQMRWHPEAAPADGRMSPADAPAMRMHEQNVSRGTSSKPKRARKVNGHEISFDGKSFVGITDEDMVRWQQAYPAIVVPDVIGQAAAWLEANPANRKSNNARYLINWMKREQDKAGRVR
jgi:uncharacterized protein YdaU (DUF1376 family)